MGVTGLWQLIAPVGRPIPLETLENKILAIDVSIWLNQAIKGFRDAQGRAQPNAHLLGLFHRVCKLLFYKIKPVFVFDGSVPLLKKQTIEHRKRTRQTAVDSIEKTAQQILTNLMAKDLVHKASSSKSASPRKAKKTASTRISTDVTEDIFWLPPLSKENSFNESQINESQNSESEDDIDELPANVLDSVMEQQFQNLNNIDIESEQFNNLPPDIRCEILSELKERRRRLFYQQNDMPEESQDFSQYQMNRLLKRRHLTKKLEEVKKELSSHEAGKLMSHLEGENMAEMHKIASEDSTHTILIRTSGLNKKPQQEMVSNQRTEVSTTNEVVQVKDPDSPSFAENEIDSIENEILLQVIEESKNVGKLSDTQSTQNKERTVAEVVDILESDESNEIDEPKAVLKKDNLCHFPKFRVMNSRSSNTDVQFLKEVPKDNFTSIKEKKQRSMEFNEEEYISDIDSPLFTKSDFEPSKEIVQEEEIYFIEDSSSSNTGSFKECQEVSCQKRFSSKTLSNDKPKAVTNIDEIIVPSEKQADKLSVVECVPGDILGHNLQTPRVLTVTFDTAARKDDELFPIEVFQNKGTDCKKSDSCTFPIPFESNENRQLVESNLTQSEDCKVSRMENDLLRLPQNVSSPVKTIVLSDQSANATSPQKSRIIEKFFAKKLTPKKFGKASTSDSDSSPTKIATPAVNALLSMNEDKLQRLEDELDSERIEFIREQRKKERQVQTVSDQIYTESQELLKLFGVPFIVSPTEAEAQCAQLELLGLTHGTITDDSDIWLFGGSKVYKNFFTQGKYLECYTNEDIEKQYGLDRRHLICFGLLTGSDYTEGIEGVGPVRAMEVISEFKNDGFETLKTFREWYDVSHNSARPPKNGVRAKLLKLDLPDSFPRQQVYEAYINPEVDVSKERFSWGLPNLDELRELSREKFGWTKLKVDEMLLPIIKKINERESQTRIDSFFQMSFRKDKNLFPSKRIEKALTKMKPGSSAEIEVEDPGVQGGSKTARKTNSRARRAGRTATKSKQTLTKEVNLSEESSESSCDEASKSKNQKLSANTNVSKNLKPVKKPVPAKKRKNNK